MTKKNKNVYKISLQEGDVVIRITPEQKIQIIFAEDNESLTRDLSWDEHLIYKTAVQFVLMIDSFLKNNGILDTIVTESDSGSIPVELVGKNILQIQMASEQNVEVQCDTPDGINGDLESDEDPTINEDNVIDASNKFNNKRSDDEISD